MNKIKLSDKQLCEYLNKLFAEHKPEDFSVTKCEMNAKGGVWVEIKRKSTKLALILFYSKDEGCYIGHNVDPIVPKKYKKRNYLGLCFDCYLNEYILQDTGCYYGTEVMC